MVVTLPGIVMLAKLMQPEKAELPMPATPELIVALVFRFTIIWESMIVIIRENRAEVIEIIWERVEPRAA